MAGYIDSIDYALGELTIETNSGAQGVKVRLNGKWLMQDLLTIRRLGGLTLLPDILCTYSLCLADPTGVYGIPQTGVGFDKRFKVSRREQ